MTEPESETDRPNPEPNGADTTTAPVEFVARPARELDLLRAIAEDQPGAELAYAEWLEQRDPPRAKAVRLRYELSQIDAADGRYAELRGEFGAIDARYWDKWVEPVAPLVGPDGWASVYGGVVTSIECRNVNDETLKCLASVPAVRELSIGSGHIGKNGVALITSLRGLRLLTVNGDITFEEGALASFDQLAPATHFEFYVDGVDQSDVDEIDDQRVEQFDGLTPEQQRRVARAFVASHGGRVRRDQPIKVTRFSQEYLRDAQMRFFTALPDVEEIDIFDAEITSKGLEYLEDLENLRRLELRKTPIDSLLPIVHHTSLRVLHVHHQYRAEIGDEGTAGLERLVNLEELHLYDSAISDATVQRLAPLVKLRELHLDIGGGLKDESSLEALAGLRELRSLVLRGPELGDVALSSLRNLDKLEALEVVVDEGRGAGLAHLAGLTKLRSLHAAGDGFTDDGIQHLAPLDSLRTFMAQGTGVTPDGARRLAEQLPRVTIILDDHVVKSPRESHAFRRYVIGGVASVLLPPAWIEEDRVYDHGLQATEDGWRGITSWSGETVGPGEIRFFITNAKEDQTAKKAIDERIEDMDMVLERALVEVRGAEQVASCVCRDGYGQYLICTAKSGDRIVSFECVAPPSRFEEFRPLFLYVAQSVRISEDKSQHTAETTTVLVKDLPTGKQSGAE